MLSKGDQERIKDIAHRAVILAAEKTAQDLSSTQVILAVALAHEKQPINLVGLLHAKDFDFIHDVWGIMRHINYATGELEDCFLPRYAR